MTIEIEVGYSREFKRALKRLGKKYRHVRDDIEPLVNEVIGGDTPGDLVPNVGYEVYKVRVANSDSNQGTRGGYRVVYYVVDEAKRWLLMAYSKADQSDVSPQQIRAIIEGLE